jgi:hypothetical protein
MLGEECRICLEGSEKVAMEDSLLSIVAALARLSFVMNTVLFLG